jgi:hypothetical protein
MVTSLRVRGLLRNRPGRSGINDVYVRPGLPLNIGWLWSPKYTPQRPAALKVLFEMIAAVHRTWTEQTAAGITVTSQAVAVVKFSSGVTSQNISS